MKVTVTTAEFFATQEAGIDAIHALAIEGLEQAGRLNALNLSALRDAAAEGARQGQALFGSDEPPELKQLQYDSLEPLIAGLVAWVRGIGEIASDTHAQFLAITQGWIAHNKAGMDAAMSDAAGSASAGSQAMFAALQSANEIATALYERAGDADAPAALEGADAVADDSADKAARRVARGSRAARADIEEMRADATDAAVPDAGA